MTSFKYLGMVISAEDNDWPAVVRSLAKTRAVWRRLTKIIRIEVTAPRVSVFFFNSMVQSVLIFDRETPVVTPPPPWAGPGRVQGPGSDTVDREDPAETD